MRIYMHFIYDMGLSTGYSCLDGVNFSFLKAMVYFREHINEIVEITLKKEVVTSLETTVRSRSILESYDTVHIEETDQNAKDSKRVAVTDVTKTRKDKKNK